MTVKPKSRKKPIAVPVTETDPTLAAKTEIETQELAEGPAPANPNELEAEIFAEELAKGEGENESEAASAVEPVSEPESEPETESDPEFTPAPRPPAKLERLQKILAQAGVASRRKAEEMIEQGRVQLNGKVVTELGTKADAGRDHIRVDGKLLQGAERLRYFVLNKPKGFVTTVKDPEGRPTVMQFFDKMKERLYPVGRLDYMSEGLLVVTNDGELANRLTKASSGVEKTYLVKVAGQPTESELEILRAGVAIERGKPGSAKVRTSPARIRQVRQGDNPWYEVVLIEGRNRELRKMFEEVGHFVEKIRRVGYGPLVLDQEPGNLRELQPAELAALRDAAEGKLRTPKSKELRRRNALDAAGLPTVAPRPTIHPRPAKPFVPKPFPERAAASDAPRSARPASDGPRKPFDKAKQFRPAAPGRADRPRRAPGAGPAKFGTGPAKYGAAKFGSTGPAKPPFRRDEGEASFTPRPPRPAWKKDSPPAPPARFQSGSAGEGRTSTDRPRFSSAGSGRTGADRSFGAKPAWNKSAPSGDRPAFKRPSAPRRDLPSHDEDLGPVRPPNLHIEEIPQSDRPAFTRTRSSAPRPGAPRSYADRPAGRPSSQRPSSDRAERPSAGRPGFDRTERPSRPFRGEGGLPRAFTTSSGKPRPGGARPSSKPGKSTGYKSGPPRSGGPGARSSSPRSSGPGGGPRGGPKGGIDPRTGSGYRPQPGGARPYARPSSGSGSRPTRPFTPRAEATPGSPLPRTKKFAGGSARPSGPRREGARSSDTGWKPKTRYGGPAKPGATRSKPRPGSSAKPSHRLKPGGKPGGKKRS